MKRDNAGTATARGVLPLAIGSFPHTDCHEVLDIILGLFPQIPLWPQLPNLTFLENMYVQFTSPMPGAVVNMEKQRVFFDTQAVSASDLEEFYSHVIEDDVEYFRFPETYASGFYALLDRLRGTSGLSAVKGHVTGPFSFGLSVADQDRRAVLHHAELYETVTAAISMNAKWQVEHLKKLAPEVIMFIDEPYLVSFGSAYVTLDREPVKQSLNQVVEAIHQAGAVAGIHCCGNTDWSLVLETDLDVLSFDAFQYFPNVVLYLDALTEFLNRGGLLAWGIVPSSEDVLQNDLGQLIDLFASYVDELEAKGVDSALVRQSGFITPACGLGSQSEAVTLDALQKTSALVPEFISRFAHAH